VQVWDAGNGQNIGTLGTHDREIRGVVFSLNGLHLASVSGEGTVNLWDVTQLGKKQEAQKPLHTFLAHSPGAALSVAFSPEGKRLVMSDKGYTLKICDLEGKKEPLVLHGHNGDVYTVAFSPDGRWVASAGEDSAVRIWDSNTGNLVRTFRGHINLVTSLAFTREGKFLVSGSRDRMVKLWDIAHLDEGPVH
jgi:WD40 repeat protein